MAASVPRESVRDSELHVSYEDQQKINTFACKNAKLDDIMEELKAKENELQALEDAETDIMMVDEEKIPFRIGDVFVHFAMDKAQEVMEEKKDEISKEIRALRDEHESIKQVMSDLKVQLYAKFGNNINLEPE